jgi:hypothetical protein
MPAQRAHQYPAPTLVANSDMPGAFPPRHLQMFRAFVGEGPIFVHRSRSGYSFIRVRFAHEILPVHVYVASSVPSDCRW